MGFRLVPKSVTGMILKSVMAVMSRYSTEFGSIGANNVKVVESKRISSATKM